MSTGRLWAGTPRRSVEAECARHGTGALVDGCLAILRDEPPDPALLQVLGGPGATKFLDGAPHPDTYWWRVWALRGLLWAWDDRATSAVCAATGDEAWRVREMAAKVVARHRVDGALEAVADLRDDPVPRVRQAAHRAVVRLTGAAL